jgi:uncharacterized protein
MAYADVMFEAPEALLAKDAPAEDLYRLGLMYADGIDVAVDLIAAHKWFNLAASRGHDTARFWREEISDQLKPADIVKAQRAARDWLKKAN